VAEELGQARLVLTLDDGPLRKGLQVAKDLIEKELGGAVGTATRRGTSGGRAGGGGPKGPDAELKAAAQLQRLSNSINVLEANGVSVKQLRARLAELQVKAAEREYTAVRQQGESLRQSISAENNKLKLRNLGVEALKRETAETTKQTIALEKRQRAELRASVTRAKQDEKFAAAFGPQLPPQAGASPAIDRTAAAERRRTRELERSRLTLERQTAAENRQRQQRQRDIAGNAIIGGAFPLLFGQGIGASFGGAGGGALGGALGGNLGFGLSLVGTALGTAFDTAITKSRELAQALDDPISNFDTLKNSALLSSKALEKQIGALIEVGRTTEAAALIQADLASSYVGLDRAKELATANDELARSWSNLSLALTDLAIEPLANITKDAATSLAGFAQAIRTIRDFTSNFIPSPPQGGQLGSSFFNPLSGGAGTAAVIEGGKGLKQLFDFFDPDKARKASEAQAAAELRIAEAVKVTSQQRSNAFRLITATVQKNEEAIETAKKQQVIDERNVKLAELKASGIDDPADPRAIRAQEEAAKALFQIEEQRRQRLRDIRKQEEGLVDVNRTKLALIQASARGNALEAAELQKQLITQEERRALDQLRASAPKVERDEITSQAIRDRAAVEEDLLRIQRDLNVEVFREAQTRAGIERSAANTLTLLGTQSGAYRDTLRTVQQIQESIAKTREEEARIGFEIGQARIAGREEEASRLVDKQRTAALQTRAAILEGALALKEAAEAARDNFRDAVLNFTKVRSDPAGLNQFLSPNRRRLRAEQDTATLLPLFRQAQQQFFELTGQRAPEFRGPRQGVNEAMQKLIDIVAKEREVTLALQNAKTAQDLLKTNQNLLEANIQLALATAKLAEKQWLVDVNVVNQAGGASTVNAVTSLAS